MPGEEDWYALTSGPAPPGSTQCRGTVFRNQFHRHFCVSAMLGGLLDVDADFQEEVHSAPRSGHRSLSGHSLESPAATLGRVFQSATGQEGVWVDDNLSAKELATLKKQQDKLDVRKARAAQHQEAPEDEEGHTGPKDTGKPKGGAAGGRGRGRGRGRGGGLGQDSTAVQLCGSAEESPQSGAAPTPDASPVLLTPAPRATRQRKTAQAALAAPAAPTGASPDKTSMAKSGKSGGKQAAGKKGSGKTPTPVKASGSPGWVKKSVRARRGEAGTFANRRRVPSNQDKFDVIKAAFLTLNASSRHQTLFWSAYVNGMANGQSQDEIVSQFQANLKPSPTKRRATPSLDLDVARVLAYPDATPDTSKEAADSWPAVMATERTKGHTMTQAASKYRASEAGTAKMKAAAKKAAAKEEAAARKKAAPKKKNKKQEQASETTHGQDGGLDPQSESEMAMEFQPLSPESQGKEEFQPLSPDSISGKSPGIEHLEDDVPATQITPVKAAVAEQVEVTAKATVKATVKAKAKATAKAVVKAVVAKVNLPVKGKAKGKAAPKAKASPKAKSKVKGCRASAK